MTVNLLRQIEPDLIIKRDKALAIVEEFENGFDRLQGVRCGRCCTNLPFGANDAGGKCGVGLAEKEGGWPRVCVHCKAVNDLLRSH